MCVPFYIIVLYSYPVPHKSTIEINNSNNSSAGYNAIDPSTPTDTRRERDGKRYEIDPPSLAYKKDSADHKQYERVYWWGVRHSKRCSEVKRSYIGTC